jgi:hypothetical protein
MLVVFGTGLVFFGSISREGETGKDSGNAATFAECIEILGVAGCLGKECRVGC